MQTFIVDGPLWVNIAQSLYNVGGIVKSLYPIPRVQFCECYAGVGGGGGACFFSHTVCKT